MGLESYKNESDFRVQGTLFKKGYHKPIIIYVWIGALNNHQYEQQQQK